MAEKKFYVGTHGPYFLDDSDDIDDPDGDFPGQTRGAFITNGPIRTSNPSSSADDVVRKEDLLDTLWPVGIVYFSILAISPAIHFGGTWSQIANGQFIVGQDTTDLAYDVGEETGGVGSHKHSVNPVNTTSNVESAAEVVDNNADISTVNVGAANHTHNVDIAPVDSSIVSNIPPYFVLYIWKRTA